MKRDMDLVRDILLAIEDNPEPFGHNDLKIEGRSNEEVAYHIKLLWQAELIEAYDVSSNSGFSWKAMSLTWKGHEFIEAARNNSRWQDAKKYILEKGGSITFDILKAVLSESIKNAIFPKTEL